MITCVLRRYVAATVLLVPNLSEGTRLASSGDGCPEIQKKRKTLSLEDGTGKRGLQC